MKRNCPLRVDMNTNHRIVSKYINDKGQILLCYTTKDTGEVYDVTRLSKTGVTLPLHNIHRDHSSMYITDNEDKQYWRTRHNTEIKLAIYRGGREALNEITNDTWKETL